MLNPTIEEIIGAGEHVPSGSTVYAESPRKTSCVAAEHYPAWGGHEPAAG